MGRNPGNRRSPAGQRPQAPSPAGTARRTVLAVPLLAALAAATASPVAGSTPGQGPRPRPSPAGRPTPWVQSTLAETLAEPLDPTKHPALGVLLAAYTRAPTEPVTVVALGSSSTAGTDQVPANRWVNRLCAAMQSRYASGPGRDSATGNLFGPRNTLPGIHFHNGGLPGARSGTYLDAARLERVRSLAPGILTHMVGSNDARDGTPAVVYRANMLRWLDALDAVLPQPHVHILIHAHERSDSTVTAFWNEYREVLQGIAREREFTVAFVDLSRDFEAVGFPKGDPLNFLKDDRIHLTPAGHDFAARLLAQALMATARSTRTPLTDSFARADGPLGTADSGQRWITTPGSTFAVSGQGVSVSAGGYAIAESSTSNVDASLRITHTGAEDRPAAVVVRADPANGAGIGLFLSAGTGQRFSLHLLGAGSDLEIWGEPRGIAPGEHEVRLVATGNTCIAYLDGSLVKAVSLPAGAAALAGNTGAGFGCGAATPAVSIRRILVREA